MSTLSCVRRGYNRTQCEAELMMTVLFTLSGGVA